MLTENCRYTNISDSPLAEFAKGARIGEPNLNLLDKFNATCLASDEDLSNALSSHPNGSNMIVLAPTHKIVDSINIQVCRQKAFLIKIYLTMLWFIYIL